MSNFFMSILENSRMGAILILDKEGTILDMSRGVEIAYGYRLEDLKGKNFSSIYLEEDRKKKMPENELKYALENGFAEDINYIIHKDGSPIWTHGESILVKDDTGEVFFIKYVYNINNEKMLENSLVESKKFSESIIDTVNEALLVMDGAFNIVTVNASFYKKFGLEEKDVSGKSFFEISRGLWDVPRLKELLEKVLPEKSVVKDFEVEFDDPDEGKKTLSINGQQIIEKGERQKKILIAIYDITEQKKFKQSISSKNEALNRVNKDLDVFVYTASHDLKAPISNIEGLISVISDHAECSGAIPSLLDMMKESVIKFKDTINDLTTVVKAEQEINDGKELMSFKEMLEEVKFDIKEQIEESDAIISEDFSKAPAINFSKKNLRSILYNLLSNAIKYRSPERRPEIKLTTKSVDEYLLLQVEDNGLGITEKDKEDVFKIYTRLHTHVEGTGVGMSIVKKIIDNTGGKIEIDSEIGQGSTFKVYFKA